MNDKFLKNMEKLLQDLEAEPITQTTLDTLANVKKLYEEKEGVLRDENKEYIKEVLAPHFNKLDDL